MASLKQTLGSAPSTQTYKYPSLPSPYPTYRSYPGSGGIGANVTFPSGSPYAASPLPTTMAQADRPIPSSRFAADYDFDPVLARIQAMSSMGLAGAKSEAEALKKQTLIDAGDVDIARDVGADAQTIEATRQNTDIAKLSTIARLNKDAADRARQLDEARNVQNLFYSGARARDIEEQGQGLLQARNDFGRSLRAALSQIQGGVLDAEERNRQATLQAALQAAARQTAATQAGAGAARGQGGGAGVTPIGVGQGNPTTEPTQTPGDYINDRIPWEDTPTEFTPQQPYIPPQQVLEQPDFMDQPYIPEAPQSVYTPPTYMEHPYIPPPGVFQPQIDPLIAALAAGQASPDPFLGRWGF